MAQSFLLNNILPFCDIITFQRVPHLFYEAFEDYINIVESDDFLVKANGRGFIPRTRFSYVISKQPGPVRIIHNKDFQVYLNSFHYLLGSTILKELSFLVFDPTIYNVIAIVYLANVMVNSMHFCRACFALMSAPRCKMRLLPIFTRTMLSPFKWKENLSNPSIIDVN